MTSTALPANYSILDSNVNPGLTNDFDALVLSHETLPTGWKLNVYRVLAKEIFSGKAHRAPPIDKKRTYGVRLGVLTKPRRRQ